MGDHEAAKSAHTKSDQEHGICLKYFKHQSSLTRGFRVRVGMLVYKKRKQGEGREKLLIYSNFTTLKMECISLLKCLSKQTVMPTTFPTVFQWCSIIGGF